MTNSPLISVIVPCYNQAQYLDECLQSATNPAYPLEVGAIVVKVDPEYFRPTEVDLLIGNPTKANTQVDWMPKYDLPALVKEMMECDLKLA